MFVQSHQDENEMKAFGEKLALSASGDVDPEMSQPILNGGILPH